MSDRMDFLHPDYEPGEFDQVERRLRQALVRDAAQVRPSNRLDTILHEAHELGPVTATGGSGPRHWLMPLAAAAAVAAIIGGVWWSGQDDRSGVTPPATNAPSLSPTPSTAPTTSSPTTSGPVATESVTLPVYFVGPVGGADDKYKLFREFVRQDLPVGATPAEKAKAALVLAINAQPYSNTDGYLQPWSGQTIGDVTVADGAITVHLANAGVPEAVVGDENKRLAVQELVWTAQAAIQQTLPVRFEVSGGATELFGSISTDQDFTRPPSDRVYEDLAPVWVTSPVRDQVLPASKAVTVRGLAIVFEATVNWQLDRGTTTLSSGHAMASIGAPMQGEYSFSLGRLAAGDYTIRVRELSAKDGSVSAEKAVTFTVK